MNQTDVIAVEWVVPASASYATRADLRQSGAELQPDDRSFTPPAGQEADYSEASFEPLVVIAGLMGLVFLARRVMSLIRDARQDGLIVDARTQPIQVRPHPSLDRGQLLVLTTNGSQFFERSKNVSDLSALLASVL